MTETQEVFIVKAEGAAALCVSALSEQVELSPQLAFFIRIMVMTSQLALARQVVQYSANQRAEIAMLSEQQVIDEVKKRCGVHE